MQVTYHHAVSKFSENLFVNTSSVMKSGSGISRLEGPTWLRLAWENCASKIAKTYTQRLVTSTSKKTSSKEKKQDNISMDSQVCVFFIQLMTVFEVNPLILLVGLCFFRPPLPTKKDNSPATRQVRSFELLDRIMACFFVVGASGVDQVWATQTMQNC